MTKRVSSLSVIALESIIAHATPDECNRIERLVCNRRVRLKIETRRGDEPDLTRLNASTEYNGMGSLRSLNFHGGPDSNGSIHRLRKHAAGHCAVHEYINDSCKSFTRLTSYINLHYKTTLLSCIPDYNKNMCGNDRKFMIQVIKWFCRTK